jgi:dTDP-glucose 4,6-dehydratase
MMNVDAVPETWLVTGGAGFIGANFVLAARARNAARLVTLDRLTYAGNLKNLESLAQDPGHLFVRGDIADQELVGGLLAQHQVRAVVHFAAESHVDRSIYGPQAFMETNVMGTFHLLEAVRRYWEGLADPKRRSFASCIFPPMRCTARLSRRTRPLRKPRPMPPTAPMPRPRRPATTWCGPIITPMGFPP